MKNFNFFTGVFFTVYFLQTININAGELNDDTVLASVNGEDITLGNVVSFQSRLSDQYKSMEDSVLFDGILKQLIQQEILSQEIDVKLKKIRYGLENNIRAFLSNELIENFSKIDVMEDEIKELYVKFSENFQSTTEYNASHILLETESDAIDILNKLQDGSDFLELAKTYSTGPSGKQGGSLGWFGRGAMVPAFEQAVFLLEVNEISKPIKTNFGWHIIKVNNIRETPVPSLEDVRGDLVSTIRQNKVETKINKIIDSANVIYSNLEINHKIIRNESILDNK